MNAEDEKALLELQDRMLNSSQTLYKARGRLPACMRRNARLACARWRAPALMPSHACARPAAPAAPQLNAQERTKQQMQHRTNLMVSELKALPDSVPTYKAVGKACVPGRARPCHAVPCHGPCSP